MFKLFSGNKNDDCRTEEVKLFLELYKHKIIPDDLGKQRKKDREENFKRYAESAGITMGINDVEFVRSVACTTDKFYATNLKCLELTFEEALHVTLGTWIDGSVIKPADYGLLTKAGLVLSNVTDTILIDDDRDDSLGTRIPDYRKEIKTVYVMLPNDKEIGAQLLQKYEKKFSPINGLERSTTINSFDSSNEN